MENPHIEKSAGELKIEEYITRIKNGESKDKIFDGLPESFKTKIEEGLSENIENKIDEESVVFVEYKDPETDKDNIESIKDEILGEYNTEERIANLNESIEKYKIDLPNLDSIIENKIGQLEIISNGAKVPFKQFVINIDGDVAEVSFIQKEDREDNKGIAVPIYLALAKALNKKGITLCASGAQYGPGHNIWNKLSQLGYTERVNGNFRFKNIEESSNKKLEVGVLVKYNGENWKINEIKNVKYVDKDGVEKIEDVYNLEREDGAILQEGGVKKFVYKNDLEI